MRPGGRGRRLPSPWSCEHVEKRFLIATLRIRIQSLDACCRYCTLVRAIVGKNVQCGPLGNGQLQVHQVSAGEGSDGGKQSLPHFECVYIGHRGVWYGTSEVQEILIGWALCIIEPCDVVTGNERAVAFD